MYEPMDLEAPIATGRQAHVILHYLKPQTTYFSFYKLPIHFKISQQDQMIYMKKIFPVGQLNYFDTVSLITLGTTVVGAIASIILYYFLLIELTLLQN
ncbi:Phosphatidylinositol-glycan biosynthesis class X protein [Entamoeba marina]